MSNRTPINSPQYAETSPLNRRQNSPVPNSKKPSSPTTRRQVSFQDDHNRWSARTDEQSDLSIFPTVDQHWLPGEYETDETRGPLALPVERTLKRRIFLFLTEPESSRGSAVFFVVLMLSIFLMNIVMILQTMDGWQYTPDDCVICGGRTVYTFGDDDDAKVQQAPAVPSIPCVCPPIPIRWTDHVLKLLIYFFSVEWCLRVLCFAPPVQPDQDQPNRGFWSLWFAHLTDSATLLDALAIFPFYLEAIEKTNGLMSLRLLRLFRVFQLLRLGQYNSTFWSLTSVLSQSILYLRLLIVVMVFGAALFGSIIYWLEKGTWQYHPESGVYRFLRFGVDGVTLEPSPFTSIPSAFWWFIVTATTVGYGDVYPTSTPGKWVAAAAMLTGVLVVAFPVSVFSELWAREIERQEAIMQAGHRGVGADTTVHVSVGVKSETTGGEAALRVSPRAVTMKTLWSSLSGKTGSFHAEVEEAETEMSQDGLENGSDDVLSSAMTMDRKDVVEIMSRLASIRENEIFIRQLLQKYE